MGLGHAVLLAELGSRCLFRGPPYLYVSSVRTISVVLRSAATPFSHRIVVRSREPRLDRAPPLGARFDRSGHVAAAHRLGDERGADRVAGFLTDWRPLVCERRAIAAGFV